MLTKGTGPVPVPDEDSRGILLLLYYYSMFWSARRLVVMRSM